MTIGNILFIVVLIILNGFFVGVEFAAVTSRRARLDLIAEPDDHSAQIVRNWIDTPGARDRLIAATQLGITLVSLALGAAGENAFEAWLDPYFHNAHFPAWLQLLDFILPALPLIISLTVVTSFHVVLGEQVPKVAVLHAPEKFALFSAQIMNIFSNIFKWFIDVLDWATRLVLGIFGLNSASVHSSVYSLDEIRQIVSGPEVDGVIEQPEREMLTAVIDFGEMVVRQVCIPRTEIIAVEAEAPLPEVIQVFTEHGLTKLPVYEETLDQIIGIIHLRELLPVLLENRNTPLKARQIAREAIFIPETISVNQLLHQFRSRRTHMAIVLDEYGGTAGVVTLQDLLEEIIGVVQDPFETTPPPIQWLPDGSAIIDGMTFIEEINQHFGLNLIEPEYDTIAGYILGKLGRIPSVGDTYEDPENDIRLRVEKMDRLRIDQVSLRHLST